MADLPARGETAFVLWHRTLVGPSPWRIVGGVQPDMPIGPLGGIPDRLATAVNGCPLGRRAAAPLTEDDHYRAFSS